MTKKEIFKQAHEIAKYLRAERAEFLPGNKPFPYRHYFVVGLKEAYRNARIANAVALKAAVEAARRASIKAHLGYFDGIVSAEVVKEIDAKEAMAKAALAAYIR